MVALLFEVDGQRYGLDIKQVVKVLPSVRVRPLPRVPDYVAGVLRYRGTMVPVIDLTRLIKGHPHADLMSTRIILVSHPGLAGTTRVLGLLAEKATEIIDEGESVPAPSGIALPEAPYLGGLTAGSGSMIQYVRVEHLLSDELRDRLFVEESSA